MIDSHAHINPIDIENVEKFIDDINNSDLDHIINVGIDYLTSEYSIQLSNQYPKFYSVIGIHPLKEGNVKDLYDLYIKNPTSKVIGIGETGLDYTEPLDEQYIKFHDSIDLANTLKLPIVIHANKTNDLCLKVIKSHKPEYGFMFHCFEPELELLNEIMELGGYISVGTPITKKNAKRSLELIKNIWLDRILIELDYPYMSDNYLSDGKNVFNKIREIKNMSYYELEKKLDENTKRLFYKM